MIAGHYRLVEHIGSGAMGVVWRAIDERLERSVAVKQILAQPGLSEAERINSRQRAMREAKNAARFQHPNAIVVFDIAQHEGDPCLIMEYLPSKSLAGVLAENPTLPLPQVARIGEQVAAALVAAHRAGIVHRDVKPGNILIDEAGTTKITDFGISRAAGDLTLTQTGLIGGTPAYLAPELARGADPSPGSDVFALGATLYQALEGVAPYGNSTNQLALLYKAANGKVEAPRKSGAATALLMSMLQTEPDERPSMAEAGERLGALARGEGDARAATVVSPALGVNGGGRQPATPAGGNPVSRTPWQRTEKQQAPVLTGAPKPVNPTSTFPPQRPTQAQPAAAPPPVRPPAQAPAAGGSGSPDSRRKVLMLATGGAAVLIIAVVVFVALSSGGGDTGGNTNAGQLPGASQEQPQQPAPSSEPPKPPSESPSDGTVNLAGAGQFINGFLGDVLDKRYDSAWGKMSKAAQGSYGSQQAFQAYWDSRKISNYNSIRSDNSGRPTDGALVMGVNVDLGGGHNRYQIRVIGENGEMRIDSDIKFGGPAA